MLLSTYQQGAYCLAQLPKHTTNTAPGFGSARYKTYRDSFLCLIENIFSLNRKKKQFVDSASICLHAEMVLELGPIYSNREVIDY